MSDRNQTTISPGISPDIVQAAMERAHQLRSQALVDGLAALTGRGRDKTERT